MKSLTKIFLFITPFFFISTLYADPTLCDKDHMCTIALNNKTNDTMHVQVDGKHYETLESGESDEVKQNITSIPNNTEECNDYVNSHTHSVVIKFTSHQASGQTGTCSFTTKLACGFNVNDDGEAYYFVGYLNPGNPICTTDQPAANYTSTVSTGNALQNADGVSYYDEITYTVKGFSIR